MNSILITFVCNYSGQEQDGDNKKFWPRRGKKKYWLSNRLPTSFVFFSKNHFGVKILEPRNELFWKKLIAFNWAWLQSIFFVRDKNSYFSNKRKRAKESDKCAFKWTQPRRKLWLEEILIVFCSTSFPLACTRWVRLTLSSLCPLF